MIEKGFSYLWSKLPTKWRVDLVILALGLSVGYVSNHYYWKIKQIEGKATKVYNWYVKDSLKEKSPRN